MTDVSFHMVKQFGYINTLCRFLADTSICGSIILFLIYLLKPVSTELPRLVLKPNFHAFVLPREVSAPARSLELIGPMGDRHRAKAATATSADVLMCRAHCFNSGFDVQWENAQYVQTGGMFTSVQVLPSSCRR